MQAIPSPASTTVADQHVLSSGFLSRVEQALRQVGVLHGSLVEGPPNLNLNAADGRRVFVKVNRPGVAPDRLAAEVEGARWASRYGLLTASPLHDGLLRVYDDAGDERFVSVWRFLDMCTPPSLMTQALALADALAATSRVPAPIGATAFDLGFFTDRIMDRLSGRTDAAANLIRETALGCHEVIAARLPATTWSWIHGDLHLRNVGWGVGGHPVVLDWESHCLGPVEWDAAQILRSLHVHTEKRSAGDLQQHVAAVVEHVDRHTGFLLDWALVDAMVAYRAASSASHLLVHGHAGHILAADMALLNAQ